jgi:MFS family permease
MAPPAPRLSALRALQSRNYRLFFTGQLVSMVGTWMQFVAQAWLVYRLTGSSVQLGLVTFCQQVPVFFLAPLGGALADRVPRRQVLLATQTASMLLALVLAVLTLAGHASMPSLFAIAVALGIVNAFDMPARQAFVVQLVDRAHVVNAIGLQSSMVTSARIIGPALAGLLVAAVGEGWCFVVNAVSFLAVLAGLAAMRDLPGPPPRSGRPPLQDIAQGFRFVGTTPPVRKVLLLVGSVSLLGLPYATLMPVLAGRVLHGNASTYGVLMGASGIGALAGAVVLARRPDAKGLGVRVMLGALGFGLALLGLSQVEAVPLALGCLALAGFSSMTLLSGCNTLVQILTPDALRGRAMAVYSMALLGMTPFGALWAGALAERVGTQRTLAVCGAACVLAGLGFWRGLEAWRAAAHAHRVTLTDAGPEGAAPQG